MLAAGAGRRFGGAKQLAPLAGRPLLEHALGLAATAPVTRTVVVLGSRADRILGQIDLHGTEPVICADWGEGMSAPLRTGIAALGDTSGALVLLGDQPLVTIAAVIRVLSVFDRGERAVRATYGGHAGHPVVIGHEMFGAISRLRGDTGARGLLSKATEVECGDISNPLDIDTPADLELAGRILTDRSGLNLESPATCPDSLWS